MAISSGLGYSRLPCLHLRPPLRRYFLQVRLGMLLQLKHLMGAEMVDSVSGADVYGRAPEWKKLNSKDLGISTSKISSPTRVVLNCLKRRGFEVYLVGGCVRDLILKRIPKDFDIITSAELKEVMRTFSRCEMIGKRFPICHVHIDDTIVEVSSFSTRAARFGRDLTLDPEKPADCDEKDYVRWRNCLQRDFTINGLMFDPYAKLVYDYTGGVKDIRKAKVRTIKPANLSLTEDCGRLLMEVNYMMAYGSAEASLRLLWKAWSYGNTSAYSGRVTIAYGNIPSTCLVRLDIQAPPTCLNLKVIEKYVIFRFAILAFHEALSEQPRDPLVIAAFSLAVHNGGDLPEALSIARRIDKQHDISFHELLEPRNLDSDALLEEVMNLAASVRAALTHMTDEYFVSQAMAKYPKAPYSDLVFFPLALYLRVCKIFECVGGGKEKGFVPKHGEEKPDSNASSSAGNDTQHADTKRQIEGLASKDRLLVYTVSLSKA
ncbi:Poly(A) polymerase I [Sesamum angolense]|uniref:Poly(A) polymerase I n=1 Tax=Sesamum angolense TaxID=2727404 RepID=A0AAE1WLD2_9LAMI|nr:Poly(A) polymerase I [Sesamum angolense]